MRARDVIGRKIVGVRQERTRDKCGDPVWHVSAFELDNGDMVCFGVAELPSDYAVEATMHKQKKNSPLLAEILSGVARESAAYWDQEFIDAASTIHIEWIENPTNDPLWGNVLHGGGWLEAPSPEVAYDFLEKTVRASKVLHFDDPRVRWDGDLEPRKGMFVVSRMVIRMMDGPSVQKGRQANIEFQVVNKVEED